MASKMRLATDPVTGDMPKVTGHVIMTVTRKEVTPIYAAMEAPGYTYGQILDQHITDFFGENEGAELSDFSFELSPEAQRDLRDSVREGRYTFKM